jgi:L-amino acid N-acyltransferase YncA
MALRLWHRLRTDGPRSTAAAVARRLRRLAWVREEHVWYQCDLSASSVRAELPGGLRLVRASREQVELVVALGQSLEEALERFDAGADVWLALDEDDDAPVFLTFVFRDATPVLAAFDGTLALPAGAACLEDAVTAPEERGLGIASAAWALIGEELQRSGVTALVAKIEAANVPSKRMAEKAGFRPVAVMQHERTGVRRRTDVLPLGGGLGDELAARLS